MRLADSPTRKHWGKQAQCEEGTGTASSDYWSQQMTEQGLLRGSSRHWQWQSPGQRKEGKHHPVGHVLRLLMREGRKQVAWRTEAACPACGLAEQFNCLSRGNTRQQSGSAFVAAANFCGYWFWFLIICITKSTPLLPLADDMETGRGTTPHLLSPEPFQSKDKIPRQEEIQGSWCQSYRQEGDQKFYTDIRKFS